MSHGILITQKSAVSPPRPTTRNKERMMNEQPSSRLPLGTILMAFITIIGLPFVPLVLAGVEAFTLKTNHVEDFFRYIGIHDELSALYDGVGKLLGF